MRKLFGNTIERLDKKGVDDLTNKDGVVMVIVILLLYATIITPLFLLISKISIPIIITTLLVGSSLLFIYLMEQDNDNDNLMFFIGFIFISLMILTMAITLRIVPYRGDDEMLLRKHKLKRITRKTKFKKIQFWKS